MRLRFVAPLLSLFPATLLAADVSTLAALYESPSLGPSTSVVNVPIKIASLSLG